MVKMCISNASKKECKTLHALQCVGNRLICFGLLLCVAVLMGLAFFSLLITYKNGIGSELRESLTEYRGITTFLSTTLFAAGISIALVLFGKSRIAQNWKRTLLVVCVVMAIVQLAWVLVQNTSQTYFEDPKRLIMMARDWVSGSMELFDQELPSASEMNIATNYLTTYPFQSGMFLYYVLMFKLFSDAAPVAIQCVNVAANIISVLALSALGGLIVRSSSGRSVMIVLIGVCVPSLLYSSFLYTNQVGFALVMVFVAIQVQLMCDHEIGNRWAYLVLSSLCYCVALVLKATFIVVGIAVALAWFLKLLCAPRIRHLILLLSCILLIIAGNVVQLAPKLWVESRLGYSIGQGIPKTAWIAIGLQNNSVLGEDMPGWWNPYALGIWAETNNDYEEMEQLSRGVILNRLDEFRTQPEYALWFFGTKLATEWLTPDFQSRYFAGINYAVVDNRELQFNTNLIGDDAASRMYSASASRAWSIVESLSGFMDGYQSFVYLFSAIGCIGLLKMRQARIELAVLPCIFIVGFMLYIVWEAKAQYLLPFFMCLIPISAYGFCFVLNIISNQMESKNTDRQASIVGE